MDQKLFSGRRYWVSQSNSSMILEILKSTFLRLESMEKLTENATNAGVFRTVVAELPLSHPSVNELKKIMEKTVIS